MQNDIFQPSASRKSILTKHGCIFVYSSTHAVWSDCQDGEYIFRPKRNRYIRSSGFFFMDRPLFLTIPKLTKLTNLTQINIALSTFESPILRRFSLVFEKIDNVDKVREKMKK